MSWQSILPNLYCWADSCIVYAVIGPEGALIVNAGTGQWLDHLDGLPARPAALACTHFFRDHSAGAARAAHLGLPVYAPEGEREFFADPGQHFRQRDTYIIYDNYWDLFAPIEPIPLAGLLRDYDHLTLAGILLEVVPLPGVTIHQVGLRFALPGDGRQIICCAEAIHSPGRMARLAPLQYNYNDLSGAVSAYYSLRDLRRLQPDVLLPSLGIPMLQDCDAALAALQSSLTRLCAGRPEERASIAAADEPMLLKVTDHVWQTQQTASTNWFLLSESGKALVIDYGYHNRGVLAPHYAKPYRRRALLHSVDELKSRFGINRIDVALISHFHDDHVCGVPLLQRLFDTQCWATTAFAELLQWPDAHCFPCDWPQPIRIDRSFAHGEVAHWEEYEFHFGPMNGHTRFASLIGFMADGQRFAHTGDQYFFLTEQGEWATDLTRWDDKVVMQNHVYRNGALLDGYVLSAAWMKEWRPQIVLSGHQAPMYTDDAFFALIDRWSHEYVDLHRDVMALGEGEAHFNLDSWGGWIWPYRTHLPAPRPVIVTITVRNPLPQPARLDVRLVGPPGWRSAAASLTAPARAEVSCQLQITPDGPCRRQPFAVELVANGRPYGQVAEALVTVGGESF
jgi:glyoxylase-like metal-dependent hydrolase (beta-lactamase superfamily II)